MVPKFLFKFGQRQFSYYHKACSEPLKYLTLGQLFDETAQRYPDRVAVKSRHEKITLLYSQVQEQANQLGASFLKLGLQPGDRIATLGGNSIHWYITSLAAAKCGLILAGLNPNYVPNELKFTLNKIRAKALVSDLKYRQTNFYDSLVSIAPELKETPPSTPLTANELPDLKYIIIPNDKEMNGVYRYKDVMGLADHLGELHDVSGRVQPDHALNVQFTSGTTGGPKAALLSHFGVINNMHHFGRRSGYHEREPVVCVQVPLFHIFGYGIGLVCGTNFGGTLIFPGPYYNKQTTIETLKEESCSAIYGTPTMYVDLCDYIVAQLPTCKRLQKGVSNFTVAVTGGALCSPELFTKISKTFNVKKIQSAFGMSEMSPITFTNTAEDTFEQRSTSVGHVLEHLEVKVVNKNGETVPFGTVGEIWYRGYSTMLGYFGDDEATKQTVTPCRWLKSGDLFILSQDGYGRVIGRCKDLIIRGGENIIPSEIEQVIETHPDVVEAHVYSANDERLGEEVCVSIKMAPGGKLTEEQVRNFCQGKLAKFKIPRYVRFCEEFPRTPIGKVKKYVLRNMINDELSKGS